MSDEVKVRTVRIKNNLYIRIEDVAELIREFAATEETDVRNRADDLVHNLLLTNIKYKLET